MAPSATEYNRLKWRSRRGLLELDLLLPPFILAMADRLTVAEYRDYRRLLECEDQDIWNWLQGREEPPDAGLAGIVARVRSFNESADVATHPPVRD